MSKIKLKTIGKIEKQEDYYPNLNQTIEFQYKRQRMEWTREWLQKNWKELYSTENYMAVNYVRQTEIYHFNWFFTMSEKQFNYLIINLGSKMESLRPFRKKKYFSAEERLSITLRYLATGEVHSCKLYNFRASKPVIMKMISEICFDIFNLLKDEFIATPTTQQEWINVANLYTFKNIQIGGCLGSLAMSYIMGRKSPRSISEYPKGLLTSIVDANENFIYVDIDEKITKMDVDLYERSNFKKLVEQNLFGIPENSETEPRYYFVCHRNLPSKSYLLKPFGFNPNTKEATPFNNENNSNEINFETVNITANRTLNVYQKLGNIFPVLAKPFEIDSSSVKNITLACIALYNYLRKTDSNFLVSSEKINIPNNPTLKDDDASMEGYDTRPIIVKNRCFKLVQKQIV